MSNHHSAKARHYAALASGIKNLNANLGETEELFGMMSQQLLYMRQLAITNGSQCVFPSTLNRSRRADPRFMAVSRLLDNELNEVTAQAQAQQQQQQAQEHSS